MVALTAYVLMIPQATGQQTRSGCFGRFSIRSRSNPDPTKKQQDLVFCSTPHRTRRRKQRRGRRMELLQAQGQRLYAGPRIFRGQTGRRGGRGQGGRGRGREDAPVAPVSPPA